MTTRSMCLTMGMVCVLSLMPVMGQGPLPDNQTEKELIALLLARIDQLERRVVELEERQDSAGPQASIPASSPQAVRKTPAELPASLISEVMETYPSLKISGFADVGFVASEDPDASKGFHEGQFVLHFSSSLSPRWSFAAETALTARPNEFSPSVERAILKYSYSDSLNLSFGRFHTPINWWNTEYHHGLWLQTTIDRPEMTKFGGEYLPVHFVGALAAGSIRAGGSNLSYGVGIGNGRSSNLVGGGDAGDSNTNRAWTTSFSAQPEGWRRLQVGGAFYQDRVLDRSGAVFREYISAAHLVWSGESPEIIAEFANVRHSPQENGDAVNNPAFYVQAAYRLPWRDRQLKPYYRYEYISIDDRDTVFRRVTGLRGSTVGFRYDLSLLVALKAELRFVKEARQEQQKAGLLQLSFTF